MRTRTLSFFTIFFIYLIAIIIGILMFHFVPQWMFIYRFLWADLWATLVIYLGSLLLKNASLYDPYWSVIPPIMLVLAALYYGSWSIHVIFMIIALSMWGIRLTYHWASLWTGFAEIDWRYQAMKEKAPKLFPLTNLFGIQLFPTLIVFVQLSHALMVINQNQGSIFFSLLGMLIIIFSTSIQLIADQQMKAFKKNHPKEKKCIDEGLWRYSRHPNYFGEIMVWWGLYLFYVGYVNVIDVMIIAPLMMTSLFVFISIPWMERKILITRPEYRDYQAKVSMLIPFFRKPDRDESTTELI